MVGVLLSLNRWIRLLANSAVAHIGERIGPHALMIAAAVGSAISTTAYGLFEDATVQIFARILWGISYASLNLATLAYAVSDRANAGKRVGASRAAIGLVRAASLVGGAWIVLQLDARSVFLIYGGLTLIALAAALILPRLPPEPIAKKGFKLARPAPARSLGFRDGLRGRRRVPAHPRLPDEGLDHLGFRHHGNGDVAGAALAGRGHDGADRRLDRRPLRRAAHRDRQCHPPRGWLRADRRRSRTAGRASDRHDARHVQHADPRAGDRARPWRRALQPGQLFDVARLWRRRRPAYRALAVPQRAANAALRGALSALGLAGYFCLVRR